ncbi:MAG: cytochrome c peroxidase [Gemmatimonadales bacterium]
MLAAAIIAQTGCRGGPASPPDAALPRYVALAYTAQVDSLELALSALAATLSSSNSTAIHAAFRQARTAYKRLEYLIEYDDHARANLYNAPLVAVVDEDDHSRVITPRGFQVIEASIFPQLSPEFRRTGRAEVEHLRRVTSVLRRESTDTQLRPWRMPFDAARMELARVATLGLAGFDATLSKDGLRESAEALRGVQTSLEGYRLAMQRRNPAAWSSLQHSLTSAIAGLDTVLAPDSFDRLGFLVQCIKPVAKGLADLAGALEIGTGGDPSVWREGATDVYAVGALDSRWFAPDYAPPPTAALVALGRRLFFDQRLSAGGRRSCATCHEPGRALTDGRARASVDAGHGRVRNTPTLINAGLQRAQFADQRVAYLEFQFEAVMANPREMGVSADTAAGVLSTDTALARQFAQALKPSGLNITGQRLSLAVAAFIRSLEALDSPFDRAVRGDTGALSPSARRGFTLFMGKAACGTCHFAPLFGGTLPPVFLESEPEVIGVPAGKAVRGARVDQDPGVFAVDRAPPHQHAFKTPSLRNVAVTAPYMHNGVFQSLEDVVDFYDAGGGNGLGMGLSNQTLSAEPMHLTDQDKQDLVAFMQSLTDTLSVRAR